MLAGTLKGVVSQRLVPTADGGPRRGLRDPAHDRPRARHDHSTPTRPASSSEVIAEGELLRHADLRPGAARATSRPGGSRSRTPCASPPARTTSSCWSPADGRTRDLDGRRRPRPRTVAPAPACPRSPRRRTRRSGHRPTSAAQPPRDRLVPAGAARRRARVLDVAARLASLSTQPRASGERHPYFSS